MAAASQAARKSLTTRRDAAILVGALAVIVIGYFLFRDRQEAPQPPTHAGQQMPGGSGQMGAAMDELPEDYASLVRLGNQQMDGGNYAMAAECYRRALDIDPSSPSVRTDFGACLHGMGLPERALEEFRRVLSEEPNHLVATFNMGIVFYNQKNADSARHYFEQTTQLNPDGQMGERASQLIQQLEG